MPPWAMVSGWDDVGSSISFMRFHWLARFQPKGICYELYRPWHFYDAVVFLKSMGSACMELLHRLRRAGTTVLFEANVDYYTPWSGTVPMHSMLPTSRQKKDAEEITQAAHAVIASSRHLKEVCAQRNPVCHWVPDNILPEFCMSQAAWEKRTDGRLSVWWSGMSSKLFELLAAEESLMRFRERIHLHLVTGDFSLERAPWEAGLRTQFGTLLKQIPHTFHRFRSISQLVKLYSTGGIIISPRFLEVPYNLGHSEWKITLGMACGLPALASPQPSYEDVASRAASDAIRICRIHQDWDEALEWACSSVKRPSETAREVVRRYYLTPLVANQHRQAVQSALNQTSKT